MTATTLTSCGFNQDTGRARKAAERGPVFITAGLHHRRSSSPPIFITDRGRPAHLLLSVRFARPAGLF
ncbi:MAG: hypothetical protein ACREEU_03680 [Acetobacteraceae bacterium]